MLQHRSSSLQAKVSQAGFTIVELMIATLVFSVILLVIIAGVVNFTTDYYKGINSSTTQDTAASVMNNLAQSIQFGEANVATGISSDGTVGYVCTDNEEFLYFLGVEVPATGSTTSTGIREFPISGLPNCYKTDVDDPAGAPTGGQQLLQSHMRVVGLSAQGGDTLNTFDVAVSVAYGDADLMCDAGIDGTTVGSCNPGAPAFPNPVPEDISSGLPKDIISYAPTSTDPDPFPDILCKGQAGSQFCDVASLTTTVQARINNQDAIGN